MRTAKCTDSKEKGIEITLQYTQTRLVSCWVSEDRIRNPHPAPSLDITPSITTLCKRKRGGGNYNTEFNYCPFQNLFSEGNKRFKYNAMSWNNSLEAECTFPTPISHSKGEALFVAIINFETSDFCFLVNILQLLINLPQHQTGSFLNVMIPSWKRHRD